jgi:nitrate reductase gamma subunit
MDRGTLLLYGVLPYAAIAVFLAGHYWRYRTDQYGWTARSTQVLESRMLRIGSTAFHFGALAAIGGHVLGILIPASWTDEVGISDDAYHVISAIGGITAGTAVIVGFVVLVWRRAVHPRVRVTTTRMDVAVFALLALAIGTGMAVTLTNVVDETHYREHVAPWFRGLLTFDPEPERMEGVTWILQVHVTQVWLLYALWPFSRLVHVWSIPVDWFRRSPVLFRGRTAAGRRAERGAVRAR